MKLKPTQIHQIVQTLNQIDPPTGKSAYTLSGKTRFAIAKNLRRLQAELDTLEEVRQKLIADYKLERVPQPDGSVRIDGPGFTDYQNAFQQALETETEVALHQISEADLDLDNNQIPSTLLAPLIDTVIAG